MNPEKLNKILWKNFDDLEKSIKRLEQEKDALELSRRTPQETTELANLRVNKETLRVRKQALVSIVDLYDQLENIKKRLEETRKEKPSDISIEDLEIEVGRLKIEMRSRIKDCECYLSK